MVLEIVSIAYLLLICLGFFLIPGRFRIYLLSIASLLYVIYLDLISGAVLLGMSLLVFAGGMGIQRLKELQKKHAAAILLGVLVVLTALAVFVQKTPLLIMFIGFSFYGFQAISYLADVYLDRIAPEKNPVKMFLYLAYFPKLVSGPIERKGDFDRALEKVKTLKFWELSRLKSALIYLVYGISLKMVIADRLLVFTSRIFGAYSDYESFTLILGALFYTVEIYCDFAGYSYMAFGISKLFGIDLNINFKTPYCASNITEFWRNWHISLSSFLRDYIYIPLGGNRKGFGRKLIFVGIVFVTCGVWHDYGLNFLVWGLLHAVYSMIDNILARFGIEWLRKGIIGRILTFVSVAFAWIFFNSASLSDALEYIGHMFTCGIDPAYFSAGFLATRKDIIEFLLSIVLIVAVLVFDRLSYRDKDIFPSIISRKSVLTFCVCFFAMLFAIAVIGIYGPDYDSANFIYMQF